MTLIRFGSFSGSCISLCSGIDCGIEEGGSFLSWYNLDVVVPWVVLGGLLIAWFVAGNRSVPGYPFFRKPHMSAVSSFFNVNLGNVNIGSLRGGGVVRRDCGSF